MINPIYIEYAIHEQCDCYKIDNPWTLYKKETMILCKVEDGLEKAKRIAIEYTMQNFSRSLERKIN